MILILKKIILNILKIISPYFYNYLILLRTEKILPENFITYLKRLPNDIMQAIKMLQKNKTLSQAFGKDVIASYIKLKNLEINDFKRKTTFNKKKPITSWEKDNTLDC